MRSINEVADLRQRYRRANCSVQRLDAHIWDRFGKELWVSSTDGIPGHSEMVSILVLCSNCGRTPNDVLDEMPFEAGGQIWPLTPGQPVP